VRLRRARRKIRASPSITRPAGPVSGERKAAALPDLGFAGVVIEGMGAGHVPEALAEIVSTLIARLPVVLASRTETGPVFSRTYGYPGGEIDLLGRGALSAGILSGVKARLLLQLLLRAWVDRAAYGAYFADR
jgi:L-asparaginase